MALNLQGLRARTLAAGLSFCLGMAGCIGEGSGAAGAAGHRDAQAAAEPVVVYTAHRIITMDGSRPEATAAAVMGGRIVAVGALEDVPRTLGDRDFKLDERFRDKVLVPGFIDNHLHPLLVGGFVLRTRFITPFDWNLPSGQVKGVVGGDAYLARLTEIEAGMEDPDEML